MSVRIPIDHAKLVDSPYSGTESIFNFSSTDTEYLVKDIVMGHRTTYLVTGYRGSGKSSLVYKLELDVKKVTNDAMFVYLNFVKYEEKSIQLRKLIRSFHLQLTEKKENRALYDKLRSSSSAKQALAQLKSLYDRTFFSLSEITHQANTETSSATYGYSVNLKDLILLATPLISSIAFICGLDLTKWYSYLPIGASAIWSIFSINNLEKKRKVETTKTNENTRESFYDDDIAEYHLTGILSELKDEAKLIFVFDELDKIDDYKLVQSLLTEFKPLMLSGLASFIAVAGQDLYYKYHLAEFEDNNPISTLFSRVHHVSLMSHSELRLLFRKILRTNTTEISQGDLELIEAYVDFLIVESKQIPRRFISEVRKRIFWENDVAFLNIDKPLTQLTLYSQILKRIEKVDDEAIAAAGHPTQVRDYFIMQLLLSIHKILYNKAGRK